MLQVFDAKSWAALMTRSILPKLGAGLAALQVNPAHQPPESLAPWHDAMAWAPYLAPGQVRPNAQGCHTQGSDKLHCIFGAQPWECPAWHDAEAAAGHSAWCLARRAERVHRLVSFP